MFVKVGLDRHHVRIYVRSLDFAEFEARGFGVGPHTRGASVQITDEFIRIMPSNVGPRWRTPPKQELGEGWHFVLNDEYEPGRRPVRCHAFVTRGQWYGDSRFVIDMLQPHLLPWPKEYSSTKEGRDAIIGDLRLRLESAAQHTGSRRIAVPGNVVQVLTQSEQERLFQDWVI